MPPRSASLNSPNVPGLPDQDLPKSADSVNKLAKQAMIDQAQAAMPGSHARSTPARDIEDVDISISANDAAGNTGNTSNPLKPSEINQAQAAMLQAEEENA